MILTKKQVEDRTNSPKNSANLIEEIRNQPTVIVNNGINNNHGRPGAKNLTESERIAIGVLSSTVGEETAAELFGIAKSTANDIKNGMRTVSTNMETGQQTRGRDVELLNKINERLESTKLSIQERAAETLLASMGLITNDKLENSSAKELAAVSNQMSQVMRNMSGNKDKETGKQAVKIIVHQPRTAREESFDVIEVGIA